MTHSADLVPVFSFGENDIYQQMPNEKGTLVYEFQKRFQSIFGFTLPLFHGRGILNCAHIVFVPFALITMLTMFRRQPWSNALSEANSLRQYVTSILPYPLILHSKACAVSSWTPDFL
jgi:hypothetical protein